MHTTSSVACPGDALPNDVGDDGLMICRPDEPLVVGYKPPREGVVGCSCEAMLSWLRCL